MPVHVVKYFFEIKKATSLIQSVVYLISKHNIKTDGPENTLLNEVHIITERGEPNQHWTGTSDDDRRAHGVAWILF